MLAVLKQRLLLFSCIHVVTTVQEDYLISHAFAKNSRSLGGVPWTQNYDPLCRVSSTAVKCSSCRVLSGHFRVLFSQFSQLNFFLPSVRCKHKLTLVMNSKPGFCVDIFDFTLVMADNDPCSCLRLKYHWSSNFQISHLICSLTET